MMDDAIFYREWLPLDKRRTHKQIQSKHLTVVNNVNIKC